MSEATQTIIVTGATGFLGSHLVKKLLEDNHRVVILKRSFSNPRRINDVLPYLICYDIDKCKLAKPFRDFTRVDAIIHTATCYGRKNESTASIFSTNTFWPLQLLEYASQQENITFFNTDTVLPKHLNNYSLSKAHFREWGEHFSKQEKIKFINIKLEHMFGANDDDSKFTTYVIKNCLANTPELKLTYGEQKRDFIHIDDVVSAYNILLCNKDNLNKFYQEFELGSGKAIFIRQFVEMIHKLTFSQTMLKFGAIDYRPDEIMYSEAKVKSLLDLGWMPEQTIEEGLHKTIAWYVKNKQMEDS
ncbi:MAG: NAD-dependent epimerase/dehydratase [Spirulinaceae cyanobacterium]